MSILTKVLVVFVVVISIALSVMLGTYATLQGNYKQAYEEALKQAEAASAMNLASSSDRFVVQPQKDMELAVAHARVGELEQQLAAAKAALEDEKSARKMTDSQILTIKEPLARIQVELAETQKLLGQEQASTQKLRAEQAAIAAQLLSAEKTAAAKAIDLRFRETEVATLKQQNKNLFDQIRDIEKRMGAVMRQNDELAAVVQAVRSEAAVAGAGTGGQAGIGGSYDLATGPGGVGTPLTSSGRGSILRLNEAVRIRGKVVEVGSKDGIQYAGINVGEDDKVYVGQVLQLFRMSPTPTYLGTLTVTRVDYQKAAGRVDPLGKEGVQVGDELTNDLKSLR